MRNDKTIVCSCIVISFNKKKFSWANGVNNVESEKDWEKKKY